MQQWSVPAWAVVAALALVLCVLVALGVLLLALLRTRARLAEAEALRERIADVERRLTLSDQADRPDPPEEYVITRVGDPEPDAAPAPEVSGQLFADLVLRESVVRVVSLAAGLRRALAPETRNRIRFEMKREVKRARKQRKADVRQARREWEARQRAAVSPESAA